ncbi:glycosyltransferase family 4 protein [archaeon]|nr:glycosyltransferase family 4 protein [archaeon]
MKSKKIANNGSKHQSKKHIKPKLLIVADTYEPKVDGTYIFMKEFIKRTTNDFDISLLVPRYRNQKDTKHLHFVDVSKRFVLSGYSNVAISFRNLRKTIKAIKENEIIFIQGPALLSFFSMFLGRRYKKKVVSYLHVLGWELFEKFLPIKFFDFFLRMTRRMSMWFYNFNDIVCIPYAGVRRELVKSGLNCRAEVANLGVDIKRFSPSTHKAKSKTAIGIAEHIQVIGYCGRVSKEKNVLTLLEGFKKLRGQSDLVLLIVGDGDPEIMDELRRQSNCVCTGFVDDVEKYMQAMDIFVMPSLTETTSLATLEAMSCGLPVISSKVGFIASYLEKGFNGEFFPRENSTMLSIKIEKFLREPLYAGGLGHNARRKVAYSFSWDRSVKKISRILKKVLME